MDVLLLKYGSVQDDAQALQLIFVPANTRSACVNMGTSCEHHGHKIISGFAQQEDEEEVSEHICEHWGHRGELWTPDGRILDVSNAGFEVLAVARHQ